MASAVAVLYAICGVLNLCCAALVLVGSLYLFRASPIISGLAGGIGLVVALLGLPDLLAAYGIWNRKHWGYVLGLVLAGINALWALASIFWGDVCSLFVCGSCSVFAFVVLLNPRYAAEFTN